MSLHDEILAIRGDTEDNSASYALGLCDAKQEAAALAIKADAEIARLTGENAVLRDLLRACAACWSQQGIEHLRGRITAALNGQDGDLFEGGDK